MAKMTAAEAAVQVLRKKGVTKPDQIVPAFKRAS